jgi:hypothetical protein
LVCLEETRDVKAVTKKMETLSSSGYTMTPPPTPCKLPRGSPLNLSKKEIAASKTSARPLRLPEKVFPRECDKVDVIANHFPVTFKRLPEYLYHYDVVIASLDSNKMVTAFASDADKDKSCLPDRILPKIWKEFVAKTKHIFRTSIPFDGKKNAYTAEELKFEGQKAAYTTELQMADPDDPDKLRSFRITLKCKFLLRM